jgi:hypothetical protein
MAAVPGLTSIYRIAWFEQGPSLSITRSFKSRSHRIDYRSHKLDYPTQERKEASHSLFAVRHRTITAPRYDSAECIFCARMVRLRADPWNRYYQTHCTTKPLQPPKAFTFQALVSVRSDTQHMVGYGTTIRGTPHDSGNLEKPT